MIKQTQSYQTSDGELFKTRYEAVQAEYKIELKNMILAATNNVGGHFTVHQVADTLVKNRLIYQRMKYFENMLNRCKPKQEISQA